MSQQVLLFAKNKEEIATAVSDAGGRLTHILASRVFVADLPADVDPKRLRAVSTVEPDDLDELGRLVSESWRQRAQSSHDEGKVLGWDTLGFASPPAHDGVQAELGNPPVPTSSYLTGTVTVGVVMVSGKAWTQPNPTANLSWVSAARDGTVYGVNNRGVAYRLSGTNWTPISSAGLLTEISVGSASVIWGRDGNSKAGYRLDGSTWTRVPGTLLSISVGSDNTVWGVDEGSRVVRWNGSGWAPSAGTLTQISVGDQNTMWGLNGNDIYRWAGGQWTPVKGKLLKISSAIENAFPSAGVETVYGIDLNGRVVRYIDSVAGDDDHWQPAGKMSQISVGSRSNIWCVNSAGNVFNGDIRCGLDLSSDEMATIRSQVMTGTDFLKDAQPLANLTFSYDWRQPVAVTAWPGPDPNPVYDKHEKMEAPWRNAALTAMGFPPSVDGSTAYVEGIRKDMGTDWAMVVYITKYPLFEPGYSAAKEGYSCSERSIIRYDVPSYGPTGLNRVFAHELCHVFGAQDEYGRCTCDRRSGYFEIDNGNCVNCLNPQVPCLMNATTLNFCDFTRRQLGWTTWAMQLGRLKWVSAAQDRTVWGIDQSGTSVRRTATWNWEPMGGPMLTQISVGRADAVWGLYGTDVWRWTSGGGWVRAGTRPMSSLSVGTDGTVWAADGNTNVWRWFENGSDWAQVTTANLKQVAAANATTAWGLYDDAIWRWTGTNWAEVTRPTSGRLSNISLTSDGILWGVNNAGALRWNGTSWQAAEGSSFVQVSNGGLTNVWGTDGLNVYQRRVLATP